MTFKVSGLDPAQFRHLYGLSDEALAGYGARRCTATQTPGFPDRIELRDAAPGESLILLNYVHQPARTPYRASHAIFVREGAETRYRGIGEIPEVLRCRWISLRAFDDAGEMLHADLMEGTALEPAVMDFFADARVSYLHAHYAKRGCYAARFDRV